MYTQSDSPGAALDWGQSVTATIASLWRWLNNQKGIGPAESVDAAVHKAFICCISYSRVEAKLILLLLR